MDDREKIRSLSDRNIGASQITEYLSILHGGKENVHFRRRDVTNVIAMDNRKLLGVDVDRTLLHFQKKKEVDSKFFYAVDADEDGFVKHIFWVDGRSRRAYLEFGDVVTFDTTYNTNKYCMPLAPFIGVNHHRQSIFFGMALLRAESTTNFCWLFETWLKAMYGKHPKSIITDQDGAMKKAINIIFPNTVHRCCPWYVMRKARGKLGLLYGKHPKFVDELGSVINCSLTISEFENAWAVMIDKYKVNNNKHLNNMFEKRADWAPVYFREIFFVEMSTSQRSESMNALLKLWVNAHTSIYKFVCSIDNIWQAEGDQDFITMNENPQLWFKFQLELDARQVYTRNVFSVFKQLLQDRCLGILIEKERDTLYEVRIDSNPDFKHWKPVSYIVNVNKEAELFSCNCKGFEFQGLLCPHALKVMWLHGIQHLPSHYVLKRWCKDANAGVKRPLNERSHDVGNSVAMQMFRALTLSDQFDFLVDLASKDADSFNLAEAQLKELVSQVKTLHNSSNQEQDLAASNEVLAMAVDVEDGLHEERGNQIFHDPPTSQCKGRKKKPARWKIPAEKLPIKGRTCGYCGLVAKHNSRTCPKVLSMLVFS
ncbi:FAR1-related sequence 1 [Rhynchospora pubera]|uniref:Protein FAR1-RELATED SEQUENCE n=2 Tax=Rhynchospora pubera TaxID=906938 RepID=A0AAV8CNB9_9POAL|nr:FAR1-related sequence 1 [Rhynchospora pubera]